LISLILIRIFGKKNWQAMTKFQDLVRHKLSLADYHAMIRHGILSENDRVELLDGEIIERSLVDPRHGGIVKRINRFFTKLLYDLSLISVQDPISLSKESEPQPDIALTRLAEDNYISHHPTPEDVFLIIEVYDATLEKDRELKGPLYATASIPHYWIVNLVDNQIEAYSRPKGDGYTLRQIHLLGEQIILPHFDLEVGVDDLLGH